MCSWWGRLSDKKSNEELIEGFGASESASDSIKALTLTDNNFMELLGKAEYSFIYFYSQTCRYCQIFEPDFSMLEYEFSGNDGMLQMLKVNAPKNKKLSELFSISKYPTLCLLNYNTKEIHLFDETHRNLQTVSDFIESYTNIKPNHDAYISNINYLDDGNFNKFMSESKDDKLLVFIAEWMQDWNKYQFPNHFYQKYPQRYAKRNFKFALIDISNPESFGIRSFFKISNAPSVIFVDKTDKVKNFQNLQDQNPVNNRLQESDLDFFLQSVIADQNSSNFSNWYLSIEDFKAREENEEENNNNNEAHESSPHLHNLNEVLEFDQSIMNDYEELIKDIHL